ncbi:MAG: hypothetical protein HOC95_02295 [Candidatus Diapherotrites archaeon]|nr:hypothetical protein [Candidatus Diapherotrites archaeon]
MIEEKSRHRTTTYTFGKYKVVIKSIPPPKDSLAQSFCIATLKVGKNSAWEWRFHHTDDHCGLDDLHDCGLTTPNTRKAAQELDFLLHCLERYANKIGIKTANVRTHPRFGRFMSKRGWKPSKVNPTCVDAKKSLSPKRNRLPSIMTGHKR